jgi:hypothetical protein
VAADVTRRVILAATAALPLVAVSGCRGVQVAVAPPKPGPAVTGLRSAIAAEQLLIARYLAALRVLGSAGSGGAAGVLTALLAQHRAHLAQLRSRLIVPPDSAAASASPPAAGSAPAQPAGNVPTTPAAAIAFLAVAERDASAVLLQRLQPVPDAPASLAQLYASIAASEATHVPVLQAAERTA